MSNHVAIALILLLPVLAGWAIDRHRAKKSKDRVYGDFSDE